MSNQTQKSPVVDPDNIQETLCDGRFHIHAHGNLATLTLTHARPKPADLFDGRLELEEVVRARITMTLDNFAALRDLLTRVLQYLLRKSALRVQAAVKVHQQRSFWPSPLRRRRQPHLVSSHA
jgi:hypothetical protein